MPSSRPIELRPSQGGKLLTSASSEACGAANWTIKRDWRRFQDQEIRSEGCDPFSPRPNTPDQPPTTDPITLIATLTRPNGAKALVVATQTTIWRYFGVDDNLYVATGYLDGTLADTYAGPAIPGRATLGPTITPTIYEEQGASMGIWIQIGTGYSTNGRRWEAESINGWLILNNGYDLPVTYRVEEMSVTPIYELRENGIASVGTIAVDHDILLCMDIVQIKEGKMDLLMAATPSWSILVPSGGFLIPGEILVTGLSPGSTYTVTTDDVGTISYLATGNVAVFPYTVFGTVSVSCDPYQAITDSGITERFQWRVLWSLPNLPRRFGAAFNCNTTQGSLIVTTSFVAKSLIPGMQVTIIGAGFQGNNLTTTILWVDGANLRISDLPSFTLTNTQMVAVDGDPTNTITGKFYDLEGDGTAILKAKSLRTSLIVYKEASIFIAQYTGDIITPWQFQQQEIKPEMALFHRDTLVSVSGAGHFEDGYTLGGASHLYAGRNQFYRFDLTNVVPMEVTALRGCADMFFAAAQSGAVFAAHNPLTEEIWFCFPSGPGPDYAIRFDYRFGTASTTSLPITAGQAIIRPEPTIVFQGDKWFLMGTSGGGLLRYGLLALRSTRPNATISKVGALVIASAPVFTNRMLGCSLAVPGVGWFAIGIFISTTQVIVLGDGNFSAKPFSVEPVIYHRNSLPYDSVLQCGLEAFGSQDTEKVTDRYTPILASQTGPTGQAPAVQVPLSITLRAAQNPSMAVDKVSTTITNPLTQNMVTATVMGAYLADRITVSGVNNPVSLVSRIYELVQVMTKGFVRRRP